MIRAPGADALQLAEDAYERAQAQPLEALRIAERALELARRSGDLSAQSAAYRAAGYARVRHGNPVEALPLLRRAIWLADRAGNARLRGLARISYASAQLDGGRLRVARSELSRARQDLTAVDSARCENLALVIAMNAGDPAAVVDSVSHAMRVLEVAGDVLWLSRLRYNRGLAYVELGRLVEAERDILQASEGYGSLGLSQGVLDAAAVLARIEARRGNAPRALALLDDHDRRAHSLGLPVSWSLLARGQVLLEAGMHSDASAATRTARQGLDEGGNVAGGIEALVQLARVASASRDWPEAERVSRAAEKALRRDRRPVRAAEASCLVARAELAVGNDTTARRRSLRAARVFETAGWLGEARGARVLAARCAAHAGSPVLGRRDLALARGIRGRGGVAAQVEERLVEAELARGSGDSAASRRHVIRGLRLLDEHRATLGATELRSSASGLGEDLATLGQRLAVERASAWQLLSVTERWRASSLRLRPVRPPDDDELAADLVALRTTVGEVEAAAVAGRPHARLLARQAQLEQAIRRKAMHSKGDGEAATRSLARSHLLEQLGDRMLVEYVALDGRLWAVTVAAGHLRLHGLGLLAEIEAAIASLRFALARQARGIGRLGRAEQAAATAADELERLIVGEIRSLADDRELVIVPTGNLHAVPWASLPIGAQRPLSLSPSVQLWLAAGAGAGDGRAVFCAGPRLSEVRGEVRELAQAYPGAVVLVGDAATAAATSAALDGATLVHIACHGRFRADNPLFSSLELADGPLMVLDIERLRRAPEMIVLSACDVALSDAQPGDELRGFAAALLAMGARTIIASVIPVPDDATRSLMRRLYAELTAGRPPSQALALAQGAAGSGAAAGFVCIGRG